MITEKHDTISNPVISTWKVSQLLYVAHSVPPTKYIRTKYTKIKWNYRILKHSINGISFPYLSGSATIGSSLLLLPSFNPCSCLCCIYNGLLKHPDLLRWP